MTVRDVDLAFSPSTNMLPIRRLELEVGAEATVPVAWLTFPDMALQRLEQVYRRVAERTYELDAPELGFHATLGVNDEGMVVDYEGLWTLEEQRR